MLPKTTLPSPPMPAVGVSTVPAPPSVPQDAQLMLSDAILGISEQLFTLLLERAQNMVYDGRLLERFSEAALVAGDRGLSREAALGEALYQILVDQAVFARSELGDQVATMRATSLFSKT